MKWPRPDAVDGRTDSTLLHRKQPPECCEKQFERDPTVGPIDTDHLTGYSRLVGGMAPTVGHRRVVPIPRNSIENRLRKLVKIFEHDPTVISRDADLLTRCSGPVGEMAPTGCRRRSYRFDATPSKTAS